MREIRLSGSEGGGGRRASPYPYHREPCVARSQCGAGNPAGVAPRHPAPLRAARHDSLVRWRIDGCSPGEGQ